MFSKWMITAIIGVAVTAGFFAVRSVNDYKAERSTTIGILKSTDHPALDMAADGIISQLKRRLDDPKIIYESAQSDNSLAQQIVQKFIQQRVDVIVSIGTTATQLAQQRTKTIPIVFASVTDPVGSGIVIKLDKPEGNITGISNFTPDLTSKQFEFYKILLPNMKNLGVIYNSGESNSVFLIEKIKAVANKHNIAIKELAVHTTNDAVFGVKSLIGGVDAILIDNDNTALGAIKGIVDVALKANIPVLCSDVDTISLGVLAVIGPDQYKLGEHAGEMVVNIVHDKIPISDLPVMFASDIQYIVNKNTADKLQVAIPSGIKVYEDK
jgi:putative ABC transport system substrate-binding protein